MNLVFPAVPNDVSKALSATFRAPGGVNFEALHTASGSALMMKALRVDEPARRQSPPHREYTIAPKALLDSRPLLQARARGWRALDITEDGRLGARLVSDPSEGPVRILQFNVGPFCESTSHAFRLLKDGAEAGSYEFRFLMMPSIRVAAVWLHEKDVDKFVALRPAPDEIPADQVLSEEDFFARIAKLAGATPIDVTPTVYVGSPRITRPQVGRRLRHLLAHEWKLPQDPVDETPLGTGGLGKNDAELRALKPRIERQSFARYQVVVSADALAGCTTVGAMVQTVWLGIPETNRS